MASPADWVKGFGPEDTAVEVARRVVSQRLASVWSFLPKAAKNPEEDIEHVHQLRVSTRRAAAAVRVFHDLGRKKRIGQITKELKQIRRAAAPARDLDVLEARLRQKCWKIAANEGLGRAIDLVAAQRRGVQDRLVRVFSRYKRRGWKRRAAKLSEPGAWKDGQSEKPIRVLAAEVLGRAAEEFFAFAATGPTELSALHQLRIRAKKLRYTVEIVAVGLDDRLRVDIYPEILEMHELLGAMNDHATAAQFFNAWREQGQEPADVLRDLTASAEQQAESARRQFLQWWSPQRSENLSRRLRQTLEEPGTGRPLSPSP
jgi:CHAD domain-containing protein